MLTTMSMCCLTAFLLTSFFLIRATQASVSFNRLPPSSGAMLYSALNCFSYNLVSTAVGISSGAGYAPIPWMDFAYIWHDTSHNHPKPTTTISSFYLYILIICGCRRDILLCRLPTWRNTHSQIWYNIMSDRMIMLQEKVQHLTQHKAYHCLPCGLQHCVCGQILPCPGTGPQIWWAVWWCPHPDRCTEQGGEVESRGTETGAPSQTQPGSSGSWRHNTLLQTGGDYLARRTLQQTASPKGIEQCKCAPCMPPHNEGYKGIHFRPLL